MSLSLNRKLSEDEVLAGLVLIDPVLFRLFFFKDDLSLGLSSEQALMMGDESPRVLECTARKVAKCIAGDTLIANPYTGGRVRADQVAGKIPVATLADDWSIIPHNHAKIWPNEVIPVFRVETRSGLSIRVSGNHPFLTGAGWKDCSDLEAGELVGVARSMPMPQWNTSGLKDCEVALIAYLLGDGGLTRSTIYFTTGSDRVLEDFSVWLSEFDPDITLRKSGKYDYAVVANKPFQRHVIVNPLRKLLIRLGLAGKGSHTKFIPEEIFHLDQAGLALFLSRLYATDGYVSKFGRIGYTSVSRRLVDDVRELLLRFGIFARVYPKRTWLGGVSYTLEIIDAADIQKFNAAVSIFGKELAQDLSEERSLATGPSRHDRVPLELVRRLISESGQSPYSAGQVAGVRLNSAYEVSRDKALRIGQANWIKPLIFLAENDVYWDEIESIKPDGVEQTYDLHVPETHNFVANSIITHNTIDLEATVLQDGLTRLGEGIDECLFFTPGDAHLTPVVDRIYGRIDRTPFWKMLVRDQRRGENTLLEFYSGSRWYFRIEGLTGTDKNVVGLRAKKIVGDELAFSNPKVYTSLLQTALPGCIWKMAGVPSPTGARNSTLYQLDQTPQGKGWSKHNYSTFINPLYQNPESQQQLLDDYEGTETVGYLTQVLGLWGEATSSSFPPDAIAVTERPYFIKRLVDVTAKDMDRLPLLLAVPTVRCYEFAVGWDYGYSPDPSVVHFAVKFEPGDDWYCYLKLELRRVPIQFQVQILDYIRLHTFSGRFVGLSTDKADAIQIFQGLYPESPSLFMWASPGGSTEVDVRLAQTREYSVYQALSEEEKKKRFAKVPNKQLYVGYFKSWMINARIPLEGRKVSIGQDEDAYSELVATTERKSDTGRLTFFHLPDPNIRGGFLNHTFEAYLYLCHAIQVGSLDTANKDKEADLIAAMGWVGGTELVPWTAPWEGDTPERDNQK